MGYFMPDPIEYPDAGRQDPAALASRLAIGEGYTALPLPGLRLLRSSRDLDDVPVLYRPGAVFVLQGAKRGFLGGETFVYDARHMLAVSVPVPFRMESRASAGAPLLALYLEFDWALAAGIADLLPAPATAGRLRPRPLISSPIDGATRATLCRLLAALTDPTETAILGPALLRELHYRVMAGAQGATLIAALRRAGSAEGIGRSLAYIRRHYADSIAVAQLAAEAGMSVAAFHLRFREMTGSTPIAYIKSLRLHEARLMLARGRHSVPDAAAAVGYASASQFSREFKRHFGRTISE